MAIAFRSVAGNKNETTGTTVTVTLPSAGSAPQSGDVMVARYAQTGTTTTVTTPSGWTPVAGPIDKSTTIREYLYYRVSNGTEGGTGVGFVRSASTADKAFAQIIIYSGTDTTTPIHASASFVETTTGTTHNAPTVNVTIANCWIVEFCSDRGSPASTSLTHATYTLRDTQVGTAAGTLTTAVAGSAGAVSISATAGGGVWTGTVSTATAILWTVALAPAASSGPTGVTATPISSSRIDVDWDPVTGALSYNVERNGVVIANPTPDSYSDTGLLSSTSYTYRVQSVS